MMEKLYGPCQDEDQMDLPPGFRFHPTDEELITHYLLNKVVDCNFVAKAVGEVDMNKIEPWELPRVAKMGEKEWYFFCVRDKKYPTGLRTNRATAAGYWKATGKDKEILMGRSLIGMKKTLVFYIGRAPKGEKTDWVIHEYRLEGKFSQKNLPKSAKTEWVICHVFYKGEKKLHISGLMMSDSGAVATSLPPLMGSSTTFGDINQSIPESNHVHCFSNPIENQTTQKNMNNNIINNPIFPFESNSIPLLKGKSNPIMHQFPSRSPFAMCDHTFLRGLIGTYGHGLKTETKMVTSSHDTGISSKFEKGKRGIEDQEAPSTSVGQVDLDSLWNY
ncbi:hypothetical protein L1987_51731 [Smallanthus sonchifolius]|uniref:Uncharacterized protein n=1 Tax=Smallanthus sonchifolius TaxID=185202 RepID=A0ACB9EQK5_9ASTR|nr:hypothetical protein L1987_51731 [Smallanthus sonchifolius]